MDLTPEHTQRLDSLLAQARAGMVDADLAASVLGAFSDSDAMVIEQILGLLQDSRRGYLRPVMSAAPDAIRLLRRKGPETARALWVALNALGVAHLRLHEYLSACHWYEQALTIALDCHLVGEAQTSRINSGLAYRGLGDAEQAVTELYRVAIDDRSLLGNRGCSHLFLAHVYADQGDLATELVHLRLSIESDSPTDVLEARSMLARALTRRGLIAEARKVLDETSLEHLQDDTPFHWAYYLVAHGDTLAAEGRVSEALLCFDSARSRLEGSDSDIPTVMVELGNARALLMTGQTRSALKALGSLNRETMCIADARDYLSMLIVACTRLGHVSDALRAAADRVRLVDNRLASDAALKAVRRQVEAECALRWATQQYDLTTIDVPPSQITKAPLMAELLAGPLERIQSSAAEYGVSVRVLNRAPRVVLAVELDALDELFRVILDNAVRFNRRAGFIEIQLLHCGQSAKVRISATGIGWSPDARPEALEPGFVDPSAESLSIRGLRAERSVRQPSTQDAPEAQAGPRLQDRSRLGQSIIDAERVGCRLRGFSSGTGSGAVFTLEIPVAAPSDQLDLRAD